MQNIKCPHCGSTNAPKQKAVWSTRDRIIAVVLFLLFFPIGILYIIIKQAGNKQYVCPDCGQPYADVKESNISDDINQMKAAAKNVVNDPKVRQSVKELKKDLIDLRDTFDIN